MPRIITTTVEGQPVETEYWPVQLIVMGRPEGAALTARDVAGNELVVLDEQTESPVVPTTGFGEFAGLTSVFLSPVATGFVSFEGGPSTSFISYEVGAVTESAAASAAAAAGTLAAAEQIDAKVAGYAPDITAAAEELRTARTQLDAALANAAAAYDQARARANHSGTQAPTTVRSKTGTVGQTLVDDLEALQQAINNAGGGGGGAALTPVVFPITWLTAEARWEYETEEEAVADGYKPGVDGTMWYGVPDVSTTIPDWAPTGRTAWAGVN